MIKNIVFDLGMVLLDFNPKKAILNSFGEENLEELYELIFNSEEWLNLDRGTITNEEAIEIFRCKCPKYEKEIIHCTSQWDSILTPIEKHISLIKLLKEKGYNLYILSNFHKLAFQHVSAKYDFFNEFKGGVVSYEVKLLKPEKEIFEVLINKYNLKPEEMVFIDDTLLNIEAGESLGIKGVHCNDKIDLKEELEKILGIIL